MMTCSSGYYLSRDLGVRRVSSQFYAISIRLSQEACGKAIFSVLSSSSSENLISEKLGIWTLACFTRQTDIGHENGSG